MPKIRELSAHVADLIAAGEVVERPASVVKELTENSVDAGASRITVEIQNGGMTFLRVTDDGCGIASEDAETAFLRHATSKISAAEDLESIHTLGFRGEALAATAAVSRIELLTCTAEASMGLSLQLDGGKVTAREDAGCPRGTTIVVRDLFFNTPARLKFMKRDSVESSSVLAVCQRQALAHPEIAFRLVKDGQEELSTTGDGDLKSAIYQIYGREFAAGLVPVEGKWEQFSLSGYITKPTCTRGNRSFQQFFVNGRYIRSRLLGAALEEAYRNQIMVGRFPGCVLRLTVPENAVDVNVHPAKTEVKFLKEKDAFDCVHYGALSALRRAPARPEMKLPATPAAEPQPHAAPQKNAAPAKNKDFFHTMTPADYKAFAAAMERAPKVEASPAVTRAVFAPSPETVQTAIPLPKTEPAAKEVVVASPIRVPTPARDTFSPAPAPAAKATETPVIPTPVEEEPWRMAGEVLRTYIIVEQGKNVFFIDKHAAHERILFEKLKAATEDIPAQVLLAPAAAGVGAEEAACILENAALLSQCGFCVEDFGGGTVLIREIPADLDPAEAENAVSEIAALLLEGRRLDPENLRDNVRHTIACKAAIKAGYRTTDTELYALAKAVMERDDLKYCPHGRPICICLTEQNLEGQFKR